MRGRSFFKDSLKLYNVALFKMSKKKKKPSLIAAEYNAFLDKGNPPVSELLEQSCWSYYRKCVIYLFS